MISVLIFILILSFLVVIHELGHFLVAKWKKVDVDEFGIGYPPRIKTLFTWKGTKFSLNAIPFGGFVKLEGEDLLEEQKDEKIGRKSDKKKRSNSAFYDKSALARLMIILAGPFVNLLYGAIAFSIIFSIIGIPTLLDGQPRIDSIVEGSPAYEAGLPINVNVIGFKIENEIYQTPLVEDVQQFVDQNRSQEVKILLSGECSGTGCQEMIQEYDIYLRSKEETPANEGAMGVVFSDMVFQDYPILEKIVRGIYFGINQALMLIYLIITSLGQILADLFSGKGVGAEVAGPVGIVHQAQKHNLLSGGLISIVNFSAMLSVNLAIMNLLPIPALDGGRALFIILEKVLGKKRVNKIEGYANYGGYLLLLTLIILITAKDVLNIFSGK